MLTATCCYVIDKLAMLTCYIHVAAITLPHTPDIEHDPWHTCQHCCTCHMLLRCDAKIVGDAPHAYMLCYTLHAGMLHAATPHDTLRHTIHANMLTPHADAATTCHTPHCHTMRATCHMRYMPHCHYAPDTRHDAMPYAATRAPHAAIIHATRYTPHGTLATQTSHIAKTLAMLATCHTPHAGDAGRCHIATLPLHAAGDDPCQTSATFRHMPLRHMPLRSMLHAGQLAMST
jgi:hypothetical protein